MYLGTISISRLYLNTTLSWRGREHCCSGFWYPVCSRSSHQTCFYTYVLLSALQVWIYHPVCSCSVSLGHTLMWYFKHCKSWFTIQYAVALWVCLHCRNGCSIQYAVDLSRLCSYTLVLHYNNAKMDIPFSMQLLLAIFLYTRKCNFAEVYCLVIHLSVTF